MIFIEAKILEWAIVFGIAFSNQIKSMRFEAMFWLSFRFILGKNRCKVEGKKPNKEEKWYVGDGCLGVKKNVRLLSSIAIVKPKIVTNRAVSFRYRGIVIIGLFIGGINFEIRKPAKILPRASRLIAFFNCGLFSLIEIVGRNRGLDMTTKKIIRVL